MRNFPMIMDLNLVSAKRSDPPIGYVTCRPLTATNKM